MTNPDRVLRLVEALRSDIEDELGVFTYDVEDDHLWLLNLDDARFLAELRQGRLTITPEIELKEYRNGN
jgi:hypothetical protein